MTRNAAPIDLPGPVRDLVLRQGARTDGQAGRVTLDQHGTMRSAPSAGWAAFKARQTIALETIAFDWRARFGPFGALSVEGDTVIERPWRGRFNDYRNFAGRTVPTRAYEVCG